MISIIFFIEAVIIILLLNITGKYSKKLKKMDLYINKMLDPLWVVDENNKTIKINPAFTDLFGYKIEEMRGRNSFKFVDSENMKIMERESIEKREKGMPSMYELGIMDKNGVSIPVLLSGAPIIKKGKVIEKIGILKDMREIKRLQEELIKRDRFATIGELSSGIAHQLRNPLSIIKNSIYFLKMKINNPDEKVLNHLKIIHQEIEIASRIINGLLDLSKAKPPKRFSIDINELIKDTIRHSQIPDNIKININMSDDSMKVYIDYFQIFQVFTNIILNGIQSIPDGGEITIDALREDGFIKLIFRDNGNGISHEHLDKIFQPLFTTKEKGVGLGLAVSKNLVEINGGKIRVESEMNRGTTFYITLPCYKENIAKTLINIRKEGGASILAG